MLSNSPTPGEVSPALLYRPKRLARLKGIDPRTLAKAIEAGQLPIVVVGETEFIPGDAAVRFFAGEVAR